MGVNGVGRHDRCNSPGKEVKAMWRLLFFVVTPLWGEDVFTEEKDSGYLERRLDDDKVLDDVVVRWRIRGSEKAWKQLRVYQRLD